MPERKPERNDMVVRLFQELGSTRAVSDRTGISVKMVGWILNKRGIPTPREGRIQWPNSAIRTKGAQMLQMCEEGCSLAEIARATGTKGAIVRDFLRKNGVTREFPTTKTGERHYAWKGRLIDKDGYVLIHVKDHPRARKHTNYIFEHRLVMEEHLGRVLEPNEVVHHRDGNKQNNALENLQLFQSNGEHLAVDLKGRCPKWTPEGKERILRAVRRNGLQKRKSNPPEKEAGAPPCTQTPTHCSTGTSEVPSPP